ncbi:unnamed protein product [Ambrosiozyma monospora]|uniref:Unnamed protein product n=1 Tax=Ambrosiozyma monospora TaxID=43982 RepID=A0ACB5SSQ2_AMBMO|nr:unnamed protein product [Ambrosiozyma monospora]
MRQALRQTSNISRDFSSTIKSQSTPTCITTMEHVKGCTLPNTNSSPDLLDEKLFNLKLRYASAPQSMRSPSSSSKRININNGYTLPSNITTSSASRLSPAQLERFKSSLPKVSSLLSQSASSLINNGNNNQPSRLATNYAARQVIKGNNVELIARLEKLTIKYNTSVPVIISSWLNGGSAGVNGIKGKLTEQDIKYLNEAMIVN